MYLDCSISNIAAFCWRQNVHFLSVFISGFEAFHVFWNYTILFMTVYTQWSKSHATHIKIFIDDCNSIQFDWINKHTISLWLCKTPRRSHHVATCSRQSISCLSTVKVQGCLFHKCNECSFFLKEWVALLFNHPA
jgi:hypothetical protein